MLGHGFVTCSVCDGFRQLYYYSQIARRLRSASWCRYNVDIPDDDFVLLRDIVAESDYTLVDRFGSDSGPVGDDLSVLPHVGRTVSGMSPVRMLRQKRVNAYCSKRSRCGVHPYTV